MTIAERPLFGKAEIQRLTDVWVEQRRNLVANPTPGTTTGWSGPYPGTVTADGYTVTNTATTTPYIFSTTSTESIVAGHVYAFRAKIKALPAAGSVFTNVNVRPHKNVGNVYYNLPTLVTVPANGVEQEVAFYWTATADIPAADAFNLSIVGNGTGLTGSKYSMRDVLIEDVGTALPSTPPAAYFAGSTSSTDNLIRNRWTGTTNASASVQESRRVNFIQNATQVSYRRGGARSGIGTKTDVGLMTFTLHNDEDPLNGGTFQPGQEVRLVGGQITPEKRTYYPTKTVYTENFSDTLSPTLVHSMTFENGAGAWRSTGDPVVPVTDATAHSGTKLARSSGAEFSSLYTGEVAVEQAAVTVTAWVRPHQGGWRGQVGYGPGSSSALADLAPNTWNRLTFSGFVTNTGNVNLYAYNAATYEPGTVDWDDITVERGSLRAQGVWSKVGTTADLYFYNGQMNVYDGVATAQATLTGLEVGHPYTVTAKAIPFDGATGTMTAAVGVVGKGTGTTLSTGSGQLVSPSYTFTATATSHTIQVVGSAGADLLWDDVKVTRNAWTHVVPAVDNSSPIFTGRVVDVKSTYPLNKATGKERTSVTVTVADAVNIHGGTMRYGVQIAEGFETFESRINRLASSALAPIEPPVQGAPKVVYSF